MTFDGLNVANISDGEFYTLQSAAFVNLSGINPGIPSVISYDGPSGTFTFGFESGGDYDLNDMTGGTLLPVASGTDFTLTYTTAGQEASVDGMTFTISPEPSTLSLMVVFGACVSGLRSLNRRRLA